MHKDSFRSGKLGIPGLVLRTQLKPGGEVLCRRPHCQLSQVKPEGFSLRPRRHTCPCAQPSGGRPQSLPTPPPPTRAKRLQQPLPGGDGPGASDGRAEPAAAGGKSHSLLPVWAPRLPERLSLTESHGPVGAGEGQKVPEASAAAVPLRLLRTLDLREAVAAERRAQVTPRGLSKLCDSDSVRLPPASVYPFVACVGGKGGWAPRGTDFTPKEGNWAGSAQEGGSEVAPNKSEVLLYSIFPARPRKVWRSPFELHAPSPALESVKTRQTGSPHCLVWQGGN